MVGKFILYARAVDPTMLVALVTLAAEQSKVPEDTKEALTHLIDYCATNPDNKLIFHASNTTFHIHSDSSYLSELHNRNCAGCHLFLGCHNYNNTREYNGEIFTISNIMKHAIS